MSSNDPHCSAQGLRDTGSIERHHARIGGGWCTREGGNTTRCDEIPGNDSPATARRNRRSIRTRNSLQELFSAALADCKRDLRSGGVVELIGNLHGDGVFAWCQVRNCDLVAFPGRVG